MREGRVKADPRVLGPGGYLVDKEPLAEMRKQVLVGGTEVLFQYFIFEMQIRPLDRCCQEASRFSGEGWVKM